MKISKSTVRLLLEFRVWGVGWGLWGVGYEVWGVGCGGWGLEFEGLDVGFRTASVERDAWITGDES